MRIALWGRIRVRRSECASCGGVHCRGAGGDGAHAIFVGREFFELITIYLKRSKRNKYRGPCLVRDLEVSQEHGGVGAEHCGADGTVLSARAIATGQLRLLCDEGRTLR